MFQEPKMSVETECGTMMVGFEEYFFNHRCIWIQGDITPEYADNILRQLKVLEDGLGAKEDAVVTVYINSHGGDVPSGLNIYRALKTSHVHIRTIATQFAGSIAAIVFLAGNERQMLKYSHLHLHEPNYFCRNRKTVEDMEQICDNLHRYKQLLSEIIADSSTLSVSQVNQLINNRNLVCDADEALKLGFATEIIDRI